MQSQGIDLSGLRDIHLPPVPSLFPLPLRFWAVFFGLVFTLLFIKGLWSYFHRLTAKKYANHKVDSITKQFSSNNYQIALELSFLMRRLALMKFPKKKVSVLTGKAWRSFLEETSKKPVFKGRAGDILEDVTYIPPESFKDKDITVLIRATKEWIAQNA